MIQHTKHLLKINGVFISSLKITENGDPYFLDNTFGWLPLDDTLNIEVCHIQDPTKSWYPMDAKTLLTLTEKKSIN